MAAGGKDRPDGWNDGELPANAIRHRLPYLESPFTDHGERIHANDRFDYMKLPI